MSPRFESRWGFKRSCPVIKVERVKWKIGGCRGWLWANTSLSLHRNGRLSSSWGGSKWQLGAPRVKAPAWARPINTKNDGCVTTQPSGRSVTPGWTEEVGLSSWRTLNYTPSPLLFILNPLPPSLPQWFTRLRRTSKLHAGSALEAAAVGGTGKKMNTA